MKTQWRCQDGKSSSLMTSASGKCLEPSKVKCGNLFDGRCERCVGSGLVWLVVSELDTFGHQQLQLYHSDWQWSLTTDTDHHQQLQVSDLCQEVGGQTSRFSSVGGWLVRWPLWSHSFHDRRWNRPEGWIYQTFFSMFTRLLVVTLLLYSLIIERSHFISV